MARGSRGSAKSLEVLTVERAPADRAIVLRFVEHLRTDGRAALKVDCWPEDENPGHSEIEAIAGDLAIEHTSIDTLPQQRRIGDHFEEALAILERLPASLGWRLTSRTNWWRSALIGMPSVWPSLIGSST